ncbi:hypothetical protein HDU76_007397 [Blyttiomyces sp. JEL0837]|nr:hypothetical protein HDU76_007397 [Blyttiomyces sp. JEL0837]
MDPSAPPGGDAQHTQSHDEPVATLMAAQQYQHQQSHQPHSEDLRDDEAELDDDGDDGGDGNEDEEMGDGEADDGEDDGEQHSIHMTTTTPAPPPPTTTTTITSGVAEEDLAAKIFGNGNEEEEGEEEGAAETPISQPKPKMAVSFDESAGSFDNDDEDEDNGDEVADGLQQSASADSDIKSSSFAMDVDSAAGGPANPVVSITAPESEIKAPYGLAPNGTPIRVMDLDQQPPSNTKLLAEQTTDIIIPSYATWFIISNINDIERKALPEFFSNKNKSKTPQVYKDYRDFMINTYRLNPSEYLTVTACRRNLAGDVCAIIRVHSFLEQWGLINYQVEADSRPSLVGPSFTGHFRVTADTPRGLQPIGPNVPVSKTAIASIPPTSSSMVTAPPPVPIPPLAANNIYGDSSNKRGKPDDGSLDLEEDDVPPQKKVKASCHSCGVDCTNFRYHASSTTAGKETSVNICRNCYLDGRFPSEFYPGDFARYEHRASRHTDDFPWSDQETLLLLEGLELYDDDWAKVAVHVGTRTKEQCINRFLEIPIEEPFLASSGGDHNVSDSKAGPFQYVSIPYSAADNPVLSVVALLASVVKPDVAKAASKAAVKALQNAAAAQTAAMEKKKAMATAAGGDSLEVDLKVESVDNSVRVKDEEEFHKKVEDAVVKAAAAGPAPDEVGKPVETKGPASSAVTLAPPSSATTVTVLERAGATALGSAAAKAASIAMRETRESRRLTMRVIDLQIQKMALKLRHFEDVEALLDSERAEVERERRILAAERAAFKKEKAAFAAMKAAAAAANATAAGSTGGSGSAATSATVANPPITPTTSGVNGVGSVAPVVVPVSVGAGGIGEQQGLAVFTMG